ncbi:hypothetical protein NA57DRAFT_58807 [Rhizodiscina lignyota]|uniref:Uncharacterized protein n=1 Tax=Rhizodiscina lignyota TaxID=1504668 RepID=A0A9P4M4L3_9PEZI|nr:hypothetical protein NA57DRAFT_58807 [Rhizodiscina lignyota]
MDRVARFRKSRAGRCLPLHIVIDRGGGWEEVPAQREGPPTAAKHTTPTPHTILSSARLSNARSFGLQLPPVSKSPWDFLRAETSVEFAIRRPRKALGSGRNAAPGTADVLRRLAAVSCANAGLHARIQAEGVRSSKGTGLRDEAALLSRRRAPALGPTEHRPIGRARCVFIRSHASRRRSVASIASSTRDTVWICTGLYSALAASCETAAGRHRGAASRSPSDTLFHHLLHSSNCTTPCSAPHSEYHKVPAEPHPLQHLGNASLFGLRAISASGLLEAANICCITMKCTTHVLDRAHIRGTPDIQARSNYQEIAESQQMTALAFQANAPNTSETGLSIGLHGQTHPQPPWKSSILTYPT